MRGRAPWQTYFYNILSGICHLTLVLECCSIFEVSTPLPGFSQVLGRVGNSFRPCFSFLCGLRSCFYVVESSRVFSAVFHWFCVACLPGF